MCVVDTVQILDEDSFTTLKRLILSCIIEPDKVFVYAVTAYFTHIDLVVLQGQCYARNETLN